MVSWHLYQNVFIVHACPAKALSSYTGGAFSFHQLLKVRLMIDPMLSFFNEIDDDLANIFISSLSSVDTWLATIQKKQAAARKKPKSILLKPVICMTHCRLYRCCSMLYFWSKDTFKMSKPQRKEANSVLFTLLSGRWYLIMSLLVNSITIC